MNALIVIGTYAGVTVVSLYWLWLFYLAVMSLARAKKAGTERQV